MPPAPVIVAGGTGEVGRRIAAELAPEWPGGVVVAGRNAERARATAATLGHGVRGAELNVERPGSIRALLRHERPALVVCSLPRGSAALAAASLRAGVRVIDVTAQAEDIEAIEALREPRATGVLSVGLTPGLTNLLAAQVVAGFDHVERLDLAVRLGLGDTHGPAALTWTLENLGGRYLVPDRGSRLHVRPFGKRSWIAFDGGRPSRAGTFNFPEQRSLARTLRVPTVRSWLALDPAAAHLLAALAGRTGVARQLAKPLARLAEHPTAAWPAGGRDGWAVWARAIGVRGGKPATATQARAGRGEAAATARVAAVVARRLLAGTEPPGVLHIEELEATETLLAEVDAAQVPAPARAAA